MTESRKQRFYGDFSKQPFVVHFLQPAINNMASTSVMPGKLNVTQLTATNSLLLKQGQI